MYFSLEKDALKPYYITRPGDKAPQCKMFDNFSEGLGSVPSTNVSHLTTTLTATSGE